MTTLATMEQLAETRGVTFDPTDVRALMALEGASAFIRATTGQTISAVESDEQELMCNWSRHLWLPQRPVTDVGAVSVRRYGETVFSPVGLGGLTWTRIGRLTYPGYFWSGPDAVAHVTYDHGYEEIPDDVVAVCCSIAVRAITNPAGQVVVSRSKTIGGAALAETFEDTASAAASGAGLTAMEERVLKRYSWQGSE